MWTHVQGIVCQWLCSFSNVDRSRFVRRDRSSPVKKNAQIFLIVVGTEHCQPRPLLTVNKLRRRPATQMGVAKSDFSQMHRSRSDLIENVEHFTQIDLVLKKNAATVLPQIRLLCLAA